MDDRLGDTRTKMTDRIDKDLAAIIAESKYYSDTTGLNEIDEDLLMQKLCSYIVRRDAQVFNDGFRKGKEK